jgi:hypothetical protein
MSIKFFFAGGEAYIDVLHKLNVENVLFSFYYMRGRKNAWRKILDNFSGKNIFIDSGAHSFFTEKGVGITHGKRVSSYKGTIDDFVDEYIDFLSKNKQHIHVYPELDIYKLVGIPKVDEWRKRMEDANLNPIPVYHVELPLSRFEEWCKKYDYVGVGSGEQGFRYVANKFAIAKKYKTKLHGFAFTKPTTVKMFPWYSVDSTSWCAGAKYGMLYMYDKRHSRLQQFANDKLKKKLGRDARAPHKDLAAFNITQWKAFEKSTENSEEYWKDRISV